MLVDQQLLMSFSILHVPAAVTSRLHPPSIVPHHRLRGGTVRSEERLSVVRLTAKLDKEGDGKHRSYAVYSTVRFFRRDSTSICSGTQQTDFSACHPTAAAHADDTTLPCRPPGERDLHLLCWRGC